MRRLAISLSAVLVLAVGTGLPMPPARARATAGEGAPMSPAGVAEARSFGPLELWLPVLWTWSEHSRWPHRFAEAMPTGGGALVQVVVLDIPAEAAAAAFAAQARAAAAELLGGGEVSQVPGTGDFPFAAEGRGTMRWGRLGPQPTAIALRGAMTGAGFAMALAAWAEDAAPLAADEAQQVLADLALAGQAISGTAGSAVAPPPVKPPPPAPPEAPATAGSAADPDLLFAGEPGPAWLPVGVAGGDFDAFAAAAPGRLQVEVPEGHGWGKTGVRSAGPVLGRDAVAGRPEALSIRFDPAATGSFVLALADRDGDDEWGAHLLRFAWMPLPEGGSKVFVDRRQSAVLQTAVGDLQPDQIVLILDPSGSATFVLPDGRRLETLLPSLPAEGMWLHAVAHSPAANQPARMALTEIRRLPAPAAAPTPAPWPDRGDKDGGDKPEVLFDGRLGRLWAPHALAGGDFGRDARLDAAGLTVSVPPGFGHATAGLYSREPVIWLERLAPDGAVTLEARLDPARTRSFLLALTRPLSSWDPAAPGLMLVWREGSADTPATGEVHLVGQGLQRSVETGPIPPDRLAVTFRPGSVEVEGLGPDALVLPWAEVVEGAAFHLIAYPFAPQPDAGTALALSSVSVMRHPARGEPAPNLPAPGVEALPFAKVFAGAPDSAWLPAAVAGGNFDAFARYEKGALVVEVPPGNSWGKTGLLSAEPLVTLDSRATLTPTRIEVQLDPSRMQTANIALSSSPSPEMWFDHVIWVTLRPEPARRAWTLSLRNDSDALTWTREIDPAWMAQIWDGRIWIDVGHGWCAVELPGGPRIRGGDRTRVGQALHATILAHPPAENAAAALALRSVRVGLVTPPGLTAVERWRYLDDAAFDPDAFLADLAAEGVAR